MDAKNRDEVPQRRREEALVRRLGEALDRIGPQGTGECPDSERIAAYYERALVPEETAQWEAHFAACARCRKILAVLAASAEAPLADQEVERLGVLAAATQGQTHRVQGAKPGRATGFYWRLRWLVPAFGAAAALAVWFVVWPPWRTSKDVQIVELRDVTPRPPLQNGDGTPAPAGNPASAVLNAPARTVAPPSKARDSQAGKSQAPKAGLDNLVALDNAVNGRVASPDKVARRATKTALAQDAAGDKKAERTEPGGGVGGATATGTLGSPSPAAPAPATPPRPAFAASSAQAEVGALQKQSAPAARAAANATPKSAAPENQPPAEGKARVMNTAPLIALSQVGRPWSLLFKLPSSGAMWRMGNDGRIDRSDDGGQTWKLQASAVQGDWLHGAVVSSTVWWLVGRDGAIARTTDGEHWARVVPPALAADASGKQPDWVSIVATDGQTATIATWDGQQYTTHDGGKTWQKQ